ncbi:hypothetical protein ACDZ28_09050 [Paenibacillus sp. RS8]|uniref:hypothetical protein n=1 Tax=Paenibacillus TaxID=44249 RepID=UPI0014839B6E|nr:hypothetical protein [Paenibacillus odorifer]
MGIANTQIKISRAKLKNNEHCPDEINTHKINESRDYPELWKPAGELLVKCFNLEKNS